MSNRDIVRRAVEAAEYAFCTRLDDSGLSGEEAAEAIAESGYDDTGRLLDAWNEWCS